MARGWGRVGTMLGSAGQAGLARPVGLAALGVLAGVSGAAGLALAPAAGVTTAPPAGAHARLVGSTPLDGATVEAAPDEVSIVLDAAPSTVESDPLQVIGPDGRRIDAGDTRADAGGSTLTVSMDPALPRPSGEYEIAYRVVSDDSHVVAGTLTFTARAAAGAEAPAPSGRDGGRRVAAAQPSEEPEAEPRGPGDQADDPRPRLVVGGIVVLALAALALRLAQRDPKLGRDLGPPPPDRYGGLADTPAAAGWASRPPATPRPHEPPAGAGDRHLPATTAPGPGLAPDWRTRPPTAGNLPATRTGDHRHLPATTGAGLPPDWRTRPPTAPPAAAERHVPAIDPTGGNPQPPADWRTRPPTTPPATGERRLPAATDAIPTTGHTSENPQLPADWRTRPPTTPPTTAERHLPAIDPTGGNPRLPADWRTRPPAPQPEPPARGLPPSPGAARPPERSPSGEWPYRPARETPEDVARAAISTRPSGGPIWEITAPDPSRPAPWPYRSGGGRPPSQARALPAGEKPRSTQPPGPVHPPAATGRRAPVAWDADSGNPVTGEWQVPNHPPPPSTWGDAAGPPDWDPEPGAPGTGGSERGHGHQPPAPDPPDHHTEQDRGSQLGGLRPRPSWEVVDRDDPAIAGWRGAVEWGAGARRALRRDRRSRPDGAEGEPLAGRRTEPPPRGAEPERSPHRPIAWEAGPVGSTQPGTGHRPEPDRPTGQTGQTGPTGPGTGQRREPPEWEAGGGGGWLDLVGSRKARKQRPGRRSSPVGAGLRLPGDGDRGSRPFALPPIPDADRHPADDEATW